MAFNPLEEKGLPIEDQFRSWNDLNVEPYDKYKVDPYTRTRVILMNGIEVESIIFSHQFARHTDNPEIKQALALSRRIEQQQQKAVNGLNPGDQTPLETTIGYEQVAVDLTSWLARHEPDPMLKQALDFALLEDFDHLYRYANLYDLLDGDDAADLTGHLTEITPGPADDPRAPAPVRRRAGPLLDAHRRSALAAARDDDRRRRAADDELLHEPRQPTGSSRSPAGLYAEIAMIEEQHVTHYESLLDPLDSWLKQLVFHEYNEIYLYWSMLQQESDKRIKALWELHLDMEIGQLQVACDAAPQVRRCRARRDPAAGAAGHAGDLRAQQAVRARDPRRASTTCAPTARTTCGSTSCPMTTGTSSIQRRSTPAARRARSSSTRPGAQRPGLPRRDRRSEPDRRPSAHGRSQGLRRS